MKKGLFLLLCLASIFSVGATALGDLAQSMKAGEIKTLSTQNLVPTISSTGVSGGLFSYAQKAAWDPASEQFLFVGSDHNPSTGSPQFVAYSAATNAWRTMPNASWFPRLSGNAMHGYDHNTIDPATGNFYHCPFGGNFSPQKYNIKTGVWTTLPSGSSRYGGFCGGIAFFPEMGGLIWAQGQDIGINFFDEKTQKWRVLSATATMGGYHNFAEYNPVHKVVWCGGGNDPGSKNSYMVDATGKVTALKQAPISLGTVWGAICTVDPVSGDYLVFGFGGMLYAYDILADTWTLQPGSNFFAPTVNASETSPMWQVVATPVSNYGVVMFAKFNGSSSAVYLYKHSSGSAVENMILAKSGEAFNVVPNPVAGTARIMFPSLEKPSRLGVFEATGKLVEEIGFSRSGEAIWNAGHAPQGYYFIRSITGDKSCAKKILVQR